MRVRPRSSSTLFAIKDEEERNRLIEEHLLKRDLNINVSSSTDDEIPVDYRVLAEESRILPRQRASDEYLRKKVRQSSR